jgi:hypothetical protein
LLILSSEFLNSEKKIAFFRTLLLIPKREARKRLLALEALVDPENISSYKRYLGYKRISVDIQRITRRLPKVRKFSGYVKSASAIGSKHSGGSGIPEPLATFVYESEENKVDWFHLLSVGDISMFSGHCVLHPDEDSNKSRNGNS